MQLWGLLRGEIAQTHVRYGYRRVHALEAGSMDFVADRLVSGARFRALTVVDVFTKGCLAFVGRALDVWAYVNKVRIDFARPGKPTHNAYVKSFNGRLRALGKGRR